MESRGGFFRPLSYDGTAAPLNKILAKDYPYWTLAVPDVVRAQIFLKHLGVWEKKGVMPNLVLRPITERPYGWHEPRDAGSTGVGRR